MGWFSAAALEVLFFTIMFFKVVWCSSCRIQRVRLLGRLHDAGRGAASSSSCSCTRGRCAAVPCEASGAHLYFVPCTWWEGRCLCPAGQIGALPFRVVQTLWLVFLGETCSCLRRSLPGRDGRIYVDLRWTLYLVFWLYDPRGRALYIRSPSLRNGRGPHRSHGVGICPGRQGDGGGRTEDSRRRG